jgi:hypothetical protein
VHIDFPEGSDEMPVGKDEVAQLVRLHPVTFAALKVAERLGFGEVGLNIPLLLTVSEPTQ